ncbi:MAG: hypothetical protein Q7R35_00965 [Elusimicrobiota bacterium]|nr:hypothetical protein [Elusimicrobiota bacterium]
MKKIMFALVLVSFASSAFAADFSSLAGLKAADINVQAAAVVVPAPAKPVKEDPQVPQDLVNKFNQVKNDIWRIESDTTWLRSDIDRLESDARQIEQNNTSDPFFLSDLQRMSINMSRYVNDAQRLGMNLKSLLNLAQKDQGLNRIARDIEKDARSLLNRAQFDIENSTQRLEWAVRGARPELIGHNAMRQAMEISRNGRDFTWKVRDISNDARSLVSKTQL